jgi:uncharacterized protein YjbI with pentapeptide repeats
MADSEHLKILEQGVEKWNAWRQANPDVVPKLDYVSLIKADLTNVNLRGAILLCAILTNANLSGADLSDTNLRVAELVETNLSGANLSSSDLSYARLVSANLSKANLGHANLTNANLSAADLSDANLRNAFLSTTNLQYAVFENIEATAEVLEEFQKFYANPEQIKIIMNNGNGQWNEWRKANPEVKPVLSHANLRGANLNHANLSNTDLSRTDLSHASLNRADLSGADLSYADLTGADLIGATLSRTKLAFANLSRAQMNYYSDREDGTSITNLREADLSGANLSDADMRSAILYGANLTDANLKNARLSDANLHNADLSHANLEGASLTNADLYNADLIRSNLTGADLTGANLSLADLVETNFSGATMTGCRIYGISAWNVTMENTVQKDLVISNESEPAVTVDNLEVGQFIYLMLNNTKIRDVINTITSKGVLILGRFSDPQRKSVLDGLREKLREFDLLPIVFDFDRPTDKDYTETVQTLAGMSMFVIADVTNPKSTPLELEATAKQFKIPFIPIIDISVDPRPFAMLVDLQKSFHWVLPTLQYESKEDLLDDENLKTYIIDRAVAKREELRAAKSQEPETILIRKKSAAAPPS